uniref:Xrn1 N-terminal domain-containing protein n=1 Tax=viral metagenome TaxID=1070528 RepID=A0A6C0H884_9ZZZZ
MGIDGFANFLFKFINNNSCEELMLESNIRKIVSNDIIFDINFLIYQELIEIETEINDIIKILLCDISVSSLDKDINILLDEYFQKDYWKIYNKQSKLTVKIFLDDLFNIIDTNQNTLLDIIIYNKIINTIHYNINKLHIIEFIEKISIFFDGIPSLSKMIEQRRRRIKNYLESHNKKIIKKEIFNNFLNNFVNIKQFINNTNILQNNKYNDILEVCYFNYFEWNNTKLVIDKSMGSTSKFIINCAIYLKNNLQSYFPNINIYINDSNINGEADVKIFQYINLNNKPIDYCIHTIDSDIIYQMIVQQIYYKIINYNITISVLRYTKNNIIQIIDGILLIKNILHLYNTINNITEVNNKYQIIWDICLIFYLFGNDHLPGSVEIGTELGLEFYLKTHYSSLQNNNIININNILNNYNSFFDFNLENLSLYLTKINETKYINYLLIIMHRFFKVNIKFINLLIYKFNLINLEEILIFLKEFIIYRGKTLTPIEYNKLDDDDLRKKFMVDNIEYKYIHLLDKNSINIIEENIDYYEEEYNGLILYIRPYYISSDPYYDICNYNYEKCINNLNIKYPLFYIHNDIKEHLRIITINNNNVDNYLKKIYHLLLSQFFSMKNIHSDNITYYKDYYIPTIENIITFINNIPKDQINSWSNIWYEEIIKDNLNKYDYINSNNHYLLISPFDNDTQFQNINNFNYKDINIKQYILLDNKK